MRKSRRIRNFIAAEGILLFFLAGCAQQEEDALVIVDTQDSTIEYVMAECERGDVSLVRDINCEYIQADQQEVTLSSGGRRIEKVCVQEGDRVKKGDVLLCLDDNNLEERIENLSYQIDLNELKLTYIDEQEKLSLDDTYYSFVYGSGLETEEELLAYQKREKEVKKEYRYQREDIEDALSFDRQELEKLKEELLQSRVYAAIDGMVYSIEDGLEGSTTKKDQVIMPVVDESDGYFLAESPELFEEISEDTIYQMRVTYGDATGDYELKPCRISEWGEKQYFEILSEPETGILSVGTKGTLTIPIETKEYVLSLPNGCIHIAGDEKYVYVRDEEGMKAVRFVKTGLEGNDRTEILEGLSEGEMVVKK